MELSPEVNAKAVGRSVGAQALSKHACPNCKSKVVRRTRRKGFLQRFVLLRFGLYPWVCRECKHRFLLGSRRDDTFGYIDDPR